MTKNFKGYRLNDGSYSMEYEKGDKFITCGTCILSSFTKGSIVELEREDGSSSPCFKLITGGCSPVLTYIFDGYWDTPWGELRAYKEKATTSPTIYTSDIEETNKYVYNNYDHYDPDSAFAFLEDITVGRVPHIEFTGSSI